MTLRTGRARAHIMVDRNNSFLMLYYNNIILLSRRTRGDERSLNVWRVHTINRNPFFYTPVSILFNYDRSIHIPRAIEIVISLLPSRQNTTYTQYIVIVIDRYNRFNILIFFNIDIVCIDPNRSIHRSRNSISTTMTVTNEFSLSNPPGWSLRHNLPAKWG